MDNETKMNSRVEYTEQDFATLHSAVTLAKDRQITRASKLLEALVDAGYPDADARRAIQLWADYEQAKPSPADRMKQERNAA
jgi:hypothetical protein